jgi:fatty acid-binding protein DegV
MFGKSGVCVNEELTNQQKRKVMSLLEKVVVLDRHHYRTNKSTTHFINKNEDNSRSVKTNAPSSAKISCVSYEQPFLEQMGSATYVRLEDTT